MNSSSFTFTILRILAVALVSGSVLSAPPLANAQEYRASSDGLIPWFRDKLNKTEKPSPQKPQKRSSKSLRIPKGGTLVLTEQGPLSPQQLANLQANRPVVESGISSPSNQPSRHPDPSPAPSPSPPSSQYSADLPPPQNDHLPESELERQKAELAEREKEIARREAEIQAKIEADRAELERREEELVNQKAKEDLLQKERDLAIREEKLSWKEVEADLVAEKLDSLSPSSSAEPVDALDTAEIGIKKSSIPAPAQFKDAKPEENSIPPRPAGVPDNSPLAEAAPASFETITPDSSSNLTPLAGDAPPAPDTDTTRPEEPTAQNSQSEIVADADPLSAPPKESAPLAPPNAPRYLIGRDKTPLYIEGPTQITPADVYLDGGTAVYLLSDEEAWSKVRLESGVAGYVASDSLTSADASPPELPLPENNAEPGSQPASQTAARNPLLHF
ncbi:MAG: hypothetical protein AAF591_00965 [Verrucomicrobiota bacterium]